MNSITDSNDRIPIRRLNTIFDRHTGSKKALAAEAGVSAPYISRILRKYKGAHDERIHTLADRYGRRLLEEEKSQKKDPQRELAPLARAMSA